MDSHNPYGVNKEGKIVPYIVEIKGVSIDEKIIMILFCRKKKALAEPTQFLSLLEDSVCL